MRLIGSSSGHFRRLLRKSGRVAGAAAIRSRTIFLPPNFLWTEPFAGPLRMIDGL